MKKIEKDTFTKYGVDMSQELNNLIAEKEAIKNKPKRRILNKYELIDLIKEKLELMPNKTLHFKKTRSFIRDWNYGKSNYWHCYEYNSVTLGGFFMDGNVYCGNIDKEVDIKTLRFINKKLDKELAKLK